MESQLEFNVTASDVVACGACVLHFMISIAFDADADVAREWLLCNLNSRQNDIHRIEIDLEQSQLIRFWAENEVISSVCVCRLNIHLFNVQCHFN